jgi:hypothetical protein
MHKALEKDKGPKLVKEWNTPITLKECEFLIKDVL